MYFSRLSASKTKHVRVCLAVREPGGGVWEVGDHGTSGAMQVLRRYGQTEAETRTLHAPERMGVGRRLVRRPRESVSITVDNRLASIFL